MIQSLRLAGTFLALHVMAAASAATCQVPDAFKAWECRADDRWQAPHDVFQPSGAGGLWEVRLSPGKGRGLFALVDISQGTRLLVEEPLVTVTLPEMVSGKGYALADMEAALEAAYAALGPAEQKLYMSCHEVRLEGEEGAAASQSRERDAAARMRIFRSNAYAVADGGVALFPRVALINHDCRPNVVNADSDGRRVVVATRDIAAGAEILTTYVPLLAETATRRQRLAQYGFRCACAACRASDRQSSGAGADASPDAMRARMGAALAALWDAIRSPGEGDADASGLAAAAVAAYVEEQGFADYYVQTARLALEFAHRRHDGAGAVAWARRHLEHHRAIDPRGTAARDAAQLLASVEAMAEGWSRP